MKRSGPGSSLPAVIEPHAKGPDEQRRCEKVEDQEAVLERGDPFAERLADLPATGAQLCLLMAEIVDSLGDLGRGHEPPALGLLAFELG